MTRLTPETFDGIVGLAGPHTRAREARPDKLWGAPAIARALGVSVDKVKSLAGDPVCPVFKPNGYFAYRHELEAWLRTKPLAKS